MSEELQIQKATLLLNAHLGQGINHRKGEVSYFCPLCNHYKRKLQVNLKTQRWHCWICDAKGNGVYNLLKKTNASADLLQSAKEISTGRVDTTTTPQQEVKTLPSDFRPLYINWNTPHYKNAVHYAFNERRLTHLDILRYNIGYCEEGPYKGMLIIPSYDKNNQLNYFVGRAFYDDPYKHKNPIWTKDVVGFENQIDYDQPLTIVEGALDAIAVRRNCIPLFGKKIMPTLKLTIVSKRVPKLYVCLDQDAMVSALSELEYYLESGVEVYFVNLTGKDPSALGFEAVTKLKRECKPLTFSDLIKYKLAV